MTHDYARPAPVRLKSVEECRRRLAAAEEDLWNFPSPDFSLVVASCRGNLADAIEREEAAPTNPEGRIKLCPCGCDGPRRLVGSACRLESRW